MRLEDIKACHVCNGINLKAIPRAPVEDLMTDEITYRDVLLCLDCDTVHYIENNSVSYEFSFKIANNVPRMKMHE